MKALRVVNSAQITLERFLVQNRPACRYVSGKRRQDFVSRFRRPFHRTQAARLAALTTRVKRRACSRTIVPTQITSNQRSRCI
jgi:hypothetical protein